MFRSLVFCRIRFFGGLIVRFTASQTSLVFSELSAWPKNDPFVVLITFFYLTFEFRQSENSLLTVSLAFFILRKCWRCFFAVTSSGSFIHGAGGCVNLNFLMESWSAMQSVISLLNIAIWSLGSSKPNIMLVGSSLKLATYSYWRLFHFWHVCNEVRCVPFWC